MRCCDNPVQVASQPALSFSNDIEPKGYTDGVIAVMRDTITALRERIGQLESPPCGCAAAGHIVTVCDAHRERDVMRDTITALREQVAELRAANDELRRQAERFRAMLDGSPLPEGM
jgi:hypothetical protein